MSSQNQNPGKSSVDPGFETHRLHFGRFLRAGGCIGLCRWRPALTRSGESHLCRYRDRLVAVGLSNFLQSGNSVTRSGRNDRCKLDILPAVPGSRHFNGRPNIGRFAAGVTRDGELGLPIAGRPPAVFRAEVSAIQATSGGCGSPTSLSDLTRNDPEGNRMGVRHLCRLCIMEVQPASVGGDGRCAAEVDGDVPI